MANYVKFRDIAAVITSGNQLAASGETLSGKLRGLVGEGGGSIRTTQAATLKGSDSYSAEFKEVYEKVGDDGKPRHESLMTSAGELGTHAADIGPNVVRAATELLYVDSANGAAMIKALNQSQGGQT